MKAGELNEYIELLMATDSQDLGGGFSRTWVNGGGTWGRVRSLAGKETFFDDQRQQVLTHEILIRHNNGLTIKPEDTILFDDYDGTQRRLSIVAIRPYKNFRDIGIRLLCQQIQGVQEEPTFQAIFNTDDSIIYNTDNEPVFNTQ